MLRRVQRERREYLYRKSLEGKESAIYERKRKIKEALEQGNPVAPELREEAGELQEALEYDDDATAVPRTHIDDEYADAGVIDPKVALTTSRDPSSRLIQFSKEMRLVIPNSQRINRGNYVVKDIVDAARTNEFTDVIMVHETRGEPDGFIVSHLPYGPTAFFHISGCVLRHDIANVGTMSQAYPHLIFHNFKTTLGMRIMNVLKYLFPVPRDDSRRAITFANEQDYISFRHHVYEKEGPKDIILKEVGPRFELKPFLIKMGTVDQTEADVEWALRSYTNTARKRMAL